MVYLLSLCFERVTVEPVKVIADVEVRKSPEVFS
jgi:hypothetical protein